VAYYIGLQVDPGQGLTWVQTGEYQGYLPFISSPSAVHRRLSG